MGYTRGIGPRGADLGEKRYGAHKGAIGMHNVKFQYRNSNNLPGSYSLHIPPQ